MIAYPVGRYLIEFGREDEIEIPEEVETVLLPLSLKIEEPVEDREALLEAARQQGRSEAGATAQAYLDAKLAEQERAYEQRLVQQRASWTEEESAKLQTALTQAITVLEQRLAESVDAVLRPFLIESLRRQIIDELVTNVGVLLASDENPVVHISGSADLLAVLQERLSSASAAIEYEPNDAIDVRIVAHHTVIESQLRAWIDRFDPSKE